MQDKVKSKVYEFYFIGKYPVTRKLVAGHSHTFPEAAPLLMTSGSAESDSLPCVEGEVSLSQKAFVLW